MEGLAINLVIGVIGGIIAAVIASHKGRNVAGWFFCGFFFPLIGIIIVACLSNLNAERAYRAQIESEQRRLREQVRQERIKTESLRQLSASRLDAHDRILGVDTRSVAGLPGGSPPPPLLASGDGGKSPVPFAPLTPEQALAQMAEGSQAAPPEGGNPPPLPAMPEEPVMPAAQAMPSAAETAWYYEVAGSPKGPVNSEDIRQFLRAGMIDGRTLLWCEDLGQWTAARDVNAFRFEALA